MSSSSFHLPGLVKINFDLTEEGLAQQEKEEGIFLDFSGKTVNSLHLNGVSLDKIMLVKSGNGDVEKEGNDSKDSGVSSVRWEKHRLWLSCLSAHTEITLSYENEFNRGGTPASSSSISLVLILFTSLVSMTH